jgi:hypothetical protein
MSNQQMPTLVLDQQLFEFVSQIGNWTCAQTNIRQIYAWTCVTRSRDYNGIRRNLIINIIGQ